MEGKRKAKGKVEPTKEKKGKQKAGTENVEENDVKEIVKLPNKMPSYMTVQVGFGLRRSYFPKTEELQAPAK